MTNGQSTYASYAKEWSWMKNFNKQNKSAIISIYTLSRPS